MTVTVEPITEKESDSGWGERGMRTVLKSLHISTPTGERKIPAHGCKGVLQHESGVLLDVDAAYYWEEPKIQVQTNYAEADETDMDILQTFDSLARFEEFIASEATLVEE